jgi:hypothetical protein
MSGDARKLTVVVAEGAWGTVECVVRPSGESPARDFLEADLEALREGGKRKPLATAKARFMVLFQMMANYGEIQGERFKSEMDGLCAFRHEVKNVQIRFPCFRDGNKWILTHGFTKKAKKGSGAWPESEVDRAEQIRGEYNAKKAKMEQNKEAGNG